MPRRSRFPWLLACLLPLAGCDGCRPGPDPANEPDQAEESVPVADFRSAPPRPFPGDASPLSGGLKPGHWTGGTQPLTSNRADVRGSLESAVTLPGGRSGSGPDAADRGQAAIRSIRPAALPRGQTRRLDFRVRVPLPSGDDVRRGVLRNRFVSTQRGVSHEPASQPWPLMGEQEYFLVVLTTRPERFSRIRVADWVRPPLADAMGSREANYRVVVPPADGLVPLAETMLDWTATAVLLWDDLAPDRLTPAQTRAIADWIRFGGTLVVNGPEAAEAMARSSIADVLPVRPQARVELDRNAAESLVHAWSVGTERSPDETLALLRDGRARLAMRGQVAPDATSVADTGRLVFVTPVGRGRVVQTLFDATGDWLAAWDSYDSFFNAALLGRPRRELVPPRPGKRVVAGAGSVVAPGTPAPDVLDPDVLDPDVLAERPLVQRYPDLGSDVAPAEINTRFRLLARDATDDGSLAPSPGGGFGAWSQDSELVAKMADALREAAGIEIPSARLVVRSLGWYLLILVPINYLVFRSAGRPEFAWFAIPLIAAAGAAWVAREARLDIGFARSYRELAILELQPEYSRGHLTRIGAIYNSLSGRYDVAFRDDDAAASLLRAEEGTTPESVRFRTAEADGPVLAGIAIPSNRVGLFRGEQVIDLPGGIRRIDGHWVNQTGLGLNDARIVQRDADGRLRVTALGDWSPGERRAAPTDAAATDATATDLSPPDQSSPDPTSGRGDIEGLQELLSMLGGDAAVPPRSARLVAWAGQPLPGIRIRPEPAQSSGRTLVIAHLWHPPDPAPRPDVNLIGDFPQLTLPPVEIEVIDDLSSGADAGGTPDAASSQGPTESVP